MRTTSKVTYTVTIDEKTVTAKQAKTMGKLLYEHSFGVVPARQTTYAVTVTNSETGVSVVADVESNIGNAMMLIPLLRAKAAVEA